MLSVFATYETNAQLVTELELKRGFVILSQEFILLCYSTFLQVFVNTVVAKICQIWCKGRLVF